MASVPRWGAMLALAVSMGGLGCSPETEDGGRAKASAWSERDRAILRSLSLASLPELPPQASNRVADDPTAAELGRRLFFDPGLSRNGEISCATCHDPKRYFTDGRPVSRGMGETTRNAPTVVGAAYAPWQFWDGRRDSLWAQALAPLEAGVEMGSTRMEVVRRVVMGEPTAALYAELFGAGPPFRDAARFPERASPFGEGESRRAWQRMRAEDREAVDRAFANVGKALAAYQRGLRPAPGRFDAYVRGLGEPARGDGEPLLDAKEIEGLRLFIDTERGQCLRCHNGPLLTNQGFHRVGTAADGGALPDMGRFLGLQAVLVDPFNCLGRHSDADPEQCRELRFIAKDHAAGEMGKFKTPSLRGLGRTAPYMHDGRFSTLAEVVEHYRKPPAGGSPAHELLPLDLTPVEAEALVAFLLTLDGDVDAPGPQRAH